MAEATTSEAAAVGRAYFEAVAARDPKAMAACWEPGSNDVLHGVADLRAPEGVEEWFGNTFRAVPDFQMEVVDLLAGGDKVAVRWHMTGTFSGDARFEGAIATGEKIDITGCDVLTVRDGKIVHNDAYMNGMQLARQLGVLPRPGLGPGEGDDRRRQRAHAPGAEARPLGPAAARPPAPRRGPPACRGGSPGPCRRRSRAASRSSRRPGRTRRSSSCRARGRSARSPGR